MERKWRLIKIGPSAYFGFKAGELYTEYRTDRGWRIGESQSNIGPSSEDFCKDWAVWQRVDFEYYAKQLLK